MKNLLSILFIFCFSLAKSQGVVQQFSEQTGGTKNGAIMMSISGKMLKMSVEEKDENKEFLAFISKIKKMSFLTNKEVTDEDRKKLKKLLAPFDELLSVEENEMTTSMFVIEKDGITSNFVMLVDYDKYLNIMELTGNIDLELMAKLPTDMSVSGTDFSKSLEKLKNIKNKNKK
ncbi:MAG: DUF4252 domain-containing protein [Dysgonamonadaceae bacterium]|nr:DUF4252 domain-containing protein [Dysgonamonadaceae bacterium]